MRSPFNPWVPHRFFVGVVLLGGAFIARSHARATWLESEQVAQQGDASDVSMSCSNCLMGKSAEAELIPQTRPSQWVRRSGSIKTNGGRWHAFYRLLRSLRSRARTPPRLDVHASCTGCRRVPGERDAKSPGPLNQWGKASRRGPLPASFGKRRGTRQQQRLNPNRYESADGGSQSGPARGEDCPVAMV